MSIRNKWDYVWKELCDPNNTWGSLFLMRILGEQYADYFVQFNESSLNTELHEEFGESIIFADKVLIAKVNNENHTVHIEFQSVPDSEMGLRMLKYDVSMTTTSSRLLDGYEVVNFPDSIIVSVRDSALSQLTRYTLRINSWSNAVELTYPVVDALEKVPEVRRVMEATTPTEVQQAIVSLLNVLPRFTSAREEHKFYRLCSMLASPKLYDETGVSEEEVSVMAQEYERTFKTQAEYYIEEGESRKERQAIQNLMRHARITEDQARQILFPTEQGGKNLNRMNLQ